MLLVLISLLKQERFINLWRNFGNLSKLMVDMILLGVLWLIYGLAECKLLLLLLRKLLSWRMMIVLETERIVLLAHCWRHLKVVASSRLMLV